MKVKDKFRCVTGIIMSHITKASKHAQVTLRKELKDTVHIRLERYYM